MGKWEERLHPRDRIGRFGDKDAITVTTRGKGGEVERRQTPMLPGGREPAVHVPASAAPPGTDLSRGLKGTNVRGKRSLAVTDLPPTVYHVTTNLPAVREAGYLRASGVGGLGGDDRDKIVSMTISPTIAEQLVGDFKLTARITRDYPDTNEGSDARRAANNHVLDTLERQAADEGWDFTRAAKPYRDGAGNDAKDLLSLYFNVRESRANIPNPLFFAGLEGLRGIDPDLVGVVKIPRENLNTGALIVDFDIGEGSLDEVRMYGDVPL